MDFNACPYDFSNFSSRPSEFIAFSNVDVCRTLDVYIIH